MNTYQAADPAKFAEIEAIASQPGYASTLRSKRSDLIAWIDEMLAGKLDVSARKLPTKLHWLLNGLEQLPVCPVCGKRDGYAGKDVKLSSGYRRVCSVKCSHEVSREKISAKLRSKTAAERA